MRPRPNPGYFGGFSLRSARYFFTIATSCGSVADFRHLRSWVAPASAAAASKMPGRCYEELRERVD
jgi:hypothetical protein